MIKKFRDISIMDMGDNVITIACDSCAGVGSLKSDIVKVDGYKVGYLSAFVPLVETIAIGATPMLVVNTLSISGDSYGLSIIAGIKDAAKSAGLNGENIVTGSTEENFDIPFTSLGITVIGDFTHRKLPININDACELYLIGLPKVGQEVLDDTHMILTLEAVHILKSTTDVIDILPVGSKGVLFELEEMVKTLNANVMLNDLLKIDIKKSAGPATCAIVAVKKDSSTTFEGINIPVNKIGKIIPK